MMSGKNITCHLSFALRNIHFPQNPQARRGSAQPIYL
jgi:hypothetical protein